MIVHITAQELKVADVIAEYRSTSGRQSGRQHRHGLPAADGPRVDRQGALGELVAAKGLNLYWSGLESVGAVDVGGLVEVRAIGRARDSLLLHDDDKDYPFVVVDVSRVPTTGEARLCGWQHRNDGMRLGVWRTDVRRPCYFVGQGLLRGAEELRRLCHQCEVEGF